MVRRVWYFLIIFALFGVILSGCIGGPAQESQRPLYYDEKAIYFINKTMYAVLEKNNLSLFYDSEKYRIELDKLIISPEMQPSVDEYILALTKFQNAGKLYDIYRLDFEIQKDCFNVANSISIDPQEVAIQKRLNLMTREKEMVFCKEDMKPREFMRDNMEENFKSGVNHLKIAIKLIPNKYITN